MNTDRLYQLSLRKKETQKRISTVSEEIVSTNRETKEVIERIKELENQIELAIRRAFGSEAEGSTLFNQYSQVKRVGSGNCVQCSFSILLSRR